MSEKKWYILVQGTFGVCVYFEYRDKISPLCGVCPRIDQPLRAKDTQKLTVADNKQLPEKKKYVGEQGMHGASREHLLQRLLLQHSEQRLPPSSHTTRNRPAAVRYLVQQDKLSEPFLLKVGFMKKRYFCFLIHTIFLLLIKVMILLFDQSQYKTRQPCVDTRSRELL